MHFREVKLWQWRNFQRLDITLRPGVTIVMGDNAQGKTNFLEALYYMARRVSPRRSRDIDLIRWGEEKAYCGVTVVDEPVSFSRELIIRARTRKEWRWNGCPEPRRGERNTIWLVGFFPHDVEIVEGPPQLRRDFLDQAISVIYPAHELLVSRYSKALFRRNVLLKERAGKELIDVYTDQMVDIGGRIIRGRRHYLQLLLPYLEEAYQRLAGGNDKVGVEYEPSKPEIEDDAEEGLRRAYGKYEKEERERGLTLVGPHRDDLIFTNDEKEFKQFASQGEQKTLALALKFSEMGIMKETKKRDVIVLLDDVFSELDRNRRRSLFRKLATGDQVICSATDVLIDGGMTGNQVTCYTCQGGVLRDDG